MPFHCEMANVTFLDKDNHYKVKQHNVLYVCFSEYYCPPSVYLLKHKIFEGDSFHVTERFTLWLHLVFHAMPLAIKTQLQ